MMRGLFATALTSAMIAAPVLARADEPVATATAGAPASAVTAGTPATAATAATSTTAAAVMPDAESVAAVASSTPFPDVPANHWAYQAVERLKADGYLTGYPDGLFRGSRPISRWEMAVLVNRVVRGIEERMPQMQQKDLDAVRSLVAGFQPELDQVKNQLNALQGRVTQQDQAIADVKQSVTALTDRVNAGRVGFSMTYRPGTTATNLSAINAGTTTARFNGVPVAPGGKLPALTSAAGTAPAIFNAGIPDVFDVGAFAHGDNFNFFRILYSGRIDNHWSYGARIKSQIAQDTAFGSSTVSPSLCPNTTTSNCSFSDLNGGQNTLPINLDYAYLQYSNPSGINAQLGRYTLFGEDYYLVSPDSFLFGGQQLSGANVTFEDPHHRFSAAFYYGIPSVSAYATAGAAGTPQQICSTGVLGFSSGINTTQDLGGLNARCNLTGQEYAFSGAYHHLPTGTSIGVNFDGQLQRQFFYWDPAFINACTVGTTNSVAVNAAGCTANGGTVAATNVSGNYVTGLGNFGFGEVALSQEFGPRRMRTWRVDASTMHRFGIDPFTGNAWSDSNAYGIGVVYASKGNIFGYTPNPVGPAQGLKNSNVGQIWFQQYGLNSTGGISGLAVGSSPLTGLGFSNFNGMQVAGATFQHWVTNSLRFGIYAAHLNNTPGVRFPIGTNGTANGCPNCFVNFLNTNYVYLDTWLYFP
ncbi:MAG: S-layer homology domain-containing protein [Candidatus Eremiobacteraeota bacterium]|nr:S-layer homology domain-containing protein [Candidatus Eremiobacteraeota bacterium]